jgi:tetratricopeptide (TPR) repeat protein
VSGQSPSQLVSLLAAPARRGVFTASACALIALALAAPPARAEEDDDQPALVAPVRPSPQGTLRSGFLLPAEDASGLKTHWTARREYLENRDERRADDEEGKLRQLKDDLALDNLFAVGAALVRESQQALAAGSPALARKRCQLARELAPALPAVHSCLGRAALAESIGATPAAVGHFLDATRTAWADPRTRRATLANAGGVVLVGLLAAGALLVLLFFARYARLYLHDAHHLFPSGARSWQTTALAVTLVLLPLLLQMGPVPLVCSAALACALYLSNLELVATALVLGLFAASPWAVEGLARVAAFGGPAADVWLVEKGEGSPAALQRLQKRLESSKPEASVAFVLAHRAKREGKLEEAEKLYRRALELGGGSPMLAATHNNLANVYLLSGDIAKATQHYTHAVELQETLAAPHFNLARAHGDGGVESLDRVQAEQARALELDRGAIDNFTGGALQMNKRSNKVVMDLPLPESSLDTLLELEGQTAAPVGDDMRALLAGPLPVSAGQLTPLLAAVLCLVLNVSRARLKPSGRCDRCGREVCKRCDADARPNEGLCAQCVNVFVRKGNVDATERIRKEVAVHRYQARKKFWGKALSLVSGASHVLLGYTLQGAIFLSLTGLLSASLLLYLSWRGFAHDPFAVRTGFSLMRLGLTAAGFVAVYGLSLRDLYVRQRAESI